MGNELNVRSPADRVPEERKRTLEQASTENRKEQKTRPAGKRKTVDDGELFWSWAMPSDRQQ